MGQFFDWQQILLYSSLFSFFALVGTLLAVPWIVSQLPADYFSRDERPPRKPRKRMPWLRPLFDVLKTAIGLIFIILGAVMLVTPGQGVLTILVGLFVMDFPGKYRLERWLVLRPGVLRGLNWLRQRRGLAPFKAPGAAHGEGLPPE